VDALPRASQILAADSDANSGRKETHMIVPLLRASLTLF
jgi:hypothetical protein